MFPKFFAKVCAVFLTGILGVMVVTIAQAEEAQFQRVVLIGATAKSAPDFFAQALEAGHTVIGIARRPEEVSLRHERFTVLKGDVYDRESIERALTGDEIVIFYLGCCSSGDINDEIVEEIDLFSRGISNVIEAMENKGNRRLIAVSTTGVEKIFVAKPADVAPLVDKLMWNRRRKFEDTRRMEIIIEASGLDYIIIRPARVVGGAPPGTVNVAVNAITYDPYNRKLTRADLAEFILGQLESETYIGTIVGVYN